MAAVSPVGRASGFEPLSPHADAAVGALYRQHSRSVFAYCLSRLGRREDAEDAVQTTFLHAVRGLRRGVVPEVEVAWLLGIARNVCLSRRAAAGRRGSLELVCDSVDLEHAPARGDRNEELIGLREALARLPEPQRQAVLLRDWRGLSYEEVAEQLGVTLANAETLIFRGRRALAQLLDEQPGTTRRRLASLGNLGSMLAWLKSALTGASVAAKVVAAATTVAAVSAAGLAVGTRATEPAPAREPARTVPAQRVVVPPRDRAVAPVPRTAAPSPQARRTKPVPRAPRPVPTPPSPPAAATPVPAAPATTPAAAPAPTPAAPAAETPAVEPAMPLPVHTPPPPQPVATPPAPALPVDVTAVVEPVAQAAAPVVEPVVAALAPVTSALPAVTVTPPAPVPLQPVTVDPAKLLP